jgi:hypothetical protein
VKGKKRHFLLKKGEEKIKKCDNRTTPKLLLNFIIRWGAKISAFFR